MQRALWPRATFGPRLKLFAASQKFLKKTFAGEEGAKFRLPDYPFPIRDFSHPTAYTRNTDTLISPAEIRKCQMKSGLKHLKTAEK